MDIRPAHPEDAGIAAELISLTMGESDVDNLGLGDHQRAIDALAHFFMKANNRFSFMLADLAEVEGEVAGLLLSFPGRSILSLEIPIAFQIWQVYGFWDTLRVVWRCLPDVIHKEAESDEYYIAHLAVSPNYQRRGIGRVLLGHAEKLARKARFYKCSLEVDIDNQPAKSLYESMEYQVVKSVVFSPRMRNKLRFNGYEHRVKKLVTT